MSPIDESLTLRQQQAVARRKQILEKALHLFAKQGFDGTSTRQIAQEAGITEGLIFHYFPTKADLLTAVLDTHHSFSGELRDFLTEAEALPTPTVLLSLATNWLKTLRREEAITLVLFGVAQTNPQVGAALQALIHEGVIRLAAYLTSRVQAGELRGDLPVESSALMFFSALMIFFISHRTLSEPEWQQRSTSFVQEMISVWLDGARE